MFHVCRLVAGALSGLSALGRYWARRACSPMLFNDLHAASRKSFFGLSPVTPWHNGCHNVFGELIWLPFCPAGEVYVLQCVQCVLACLPSRLTNHGHFGSCEEGSFVPPKLAPIQWILNHTIVDEQLATKLPHERDTIQLPAHRQGVRLCDKRNHQLNVLHRGVLQ